MSPDEFYKAVLAFLDQFITRGAAPDVLGLRQRLAIDPETRQLRRTLAKEAKAATTAAPALMTAGSSPVVTGSQRQTR